MPSSRLNVSVPYIGAGLTTYYFCVVGNIDVTVFVQLDTSVPCHCVQVDLKKIMQKVFKKK